MSKYLLIVGALLFLMVSCAKQDSVASANNAQKKVHIIFDTDIGPGSDDVGAFAVMHALADKGEAKILAAVASNRYPKIAEVIDVLNTYFNRPDIPIGVPKGPSVELKDLQGWSDSLVANYPHSINSNRDVPGSVEVYRKVLSQQPDHTVTIISAGYFTNLANLLTSQPDKYSNLSGKELINRKVIKLVSMAGSFPSGKGFNIYNDIPSANYVFENWPTAIIFVGVKIGKKIKTGLPLINNPKIKNDPVKDVFRISITQNQKYQNGYPSWDETAMLVAIRGASPYFKKIPGHISTVDATLKTHWDSSKTGQFYLVLKKPGSYMENLINKLIQHQPKNN